MMAAIKSAWMLSSLGAVVAGVAAHYSNFTETRW